MSSKTLWLLITAMLAVNGCGGRDQSRGGGPQVKSVLSNSLLESPSKATGQVLVESQRVAPLTTAEKLSWLERNKYVADVSSMAEPFNLNAATAYVANRGSLGFFEPAGVEYFDSARGRATLKIRDIRDGLGPVVPSVTLRIHNDAVQNQLIDCVIYNSDGYQMEFLTVPGWNVWYPPSATIVTQVSSKHIFFVLPKSSSGDWSFVRLIASEQDTAQIFWSFDGCDITPFGL